ncbi:MAG: hypothetical protein UFG06_14015 [Lachnospiraceae bacterium]|nr:hypothetical protein [Lachnospiraceae bacterium]
MKHNLLPFNLQFFADEDISENNPEAAEPEEVIDVQTDVDNEDNSTGVKEQEIAAPVQSQEDNAQFAAARRKAEAENRAKEAEINRRIEERCKGTVNPKTGAPIKTIDDYFDAIDAQEEISRMNMLKEKGIDPALLEEAISKNHVVLEAQKVMERQKQADMDKRIENDIANITKINPSIKSVEDLAKEPNFAEVYERWQRSSYQDSLYDIYRIVNFDRLTNARADAAKQAAINQAKGKNHLETTGGSLAGNNNLVDIPVNELATWKEAFPEATMEQLKEKYNKTL